MKRYESAYDQSPIEPRFEQMRKGEWYSISTTSPLLDRDTNRLEHGSNGALLAVLKLPSQNNSGEDKQLHIVDFGVSDRSTAIFWMSERGEVRAVGTTRARFGVLAANFSPSTHMVGFAQLPPGDTMLGRGANHASYLVGLGDDPDYNNMHDSSISREHCHIYVSDDLQDIFVMDTSLNGTELMTTSSSQ